MLAILTSAPYRIVIRSSDSKQLATCLLERCEVDSIEFLSNEQLAVSTRESQSAIEAVTELAISGEIQVFEVISTDDSLKTLFSTLMRIHRGELKYQRGSEADVSKEEVPQ